MNNNFKRLVSSLMAFVMVLSSMVFANVSSVMAGVADMTTVSSATNAKFGGTIQGKTSNYSTYWIADGTTTNGISDDDYMDITIKAGSSGVKNSGKMFNDATLAYSKGLKDPTIEINVKTAGTLVIDYAGGGNNRYATITYNGTGYNTGKTGANGTGIQTYFDVDAENTGIYTLTKGDSNIYVYAIGFIASGTTSETTYYWSLDTSTFDTLGYTGTLALSQSSTSADSNVLTYTGTDYELKDRTVTSAKATSGTGTETDPYVIKPDATWFNQLITLNISVANAGGKTLTLTGITTGKKYTIVLDDEGNATQTLVVDNYNPAIEGGTLGYSTWGLSSLSTAITDTFTEDVAVELAYQYNISDLESVTYSDIFYSADNKLKFIATSDKSLVVDANNKSFTIADKTTVSGTKRMKLGGTGNTTERAVSFTPVADGTIYFYAISGSTSATRSLAISDGTTETAAATACSGSAVTEVAFDVKADITYYVYSSNGGINIYYIAATMDLKAFETAEETTEASTEETTTEVTTEETTTEVTTEETTETTTVSDEVVYPSISVPMGSYSNIQAGLDTNAFNVSSGCTTAKNQVTIPVGEYVSFVVDQDCTMTFMVGSKAMNVVDEDGNKTEYKTGAQTITLKAGKYYVESAHETGNTVLKTDSSHPWVFAAVEESTESTTETTTTTTTETTTTTTTETTTEATTAEPVASTYNHSFTDNGLTSDFYTISGKTTTGSVDYNGTTYTVGLKMESSTSIKFTGAGTLTLVFAAASGKKVEIDGTTYDIPDDGVLTVTLDAGDHTIAKGTTGTSGTNLYYMSFTTTGSSSTTTKVVYKNSFGDLEAGSYGTISFYSADGKLAFGPNFTVNDYSADITYADNTTSTNSARHLFANAAGNANSRTITFTPVEDGTAYIYAVASNKTGSYNVNGTSVSLVATDWSDKIMVAEFDVTAGTQYVVYPEKQTYTYAFAATTDLVANEVSKVTFTTDDVTVADLIGKFTLNVGSGKTTALISSLTVAKDSAYSLTYSGKDYTMTEISGTAAADTTEDMVFAVAKYTVHFRTDIKDYKKRFVVKNSAGKIVVYFTSDSNPTNHTGSSISASGYEDFEDYRKDALNKYYEIPYGSYTIEYEGTNYVPYVNGEKLENSSTISFDVPTVTLLDIVMEPVENTTTEITLPTGELPLGLTDLSNLGVTEGETYTATGVYVGNSVKYGDNVVAGTSSTAGYITFTVPEGTYNVSITTKEQAGALYTYSDNASINGSANSSIALDSNFANYTLVLTGGTYLIKGATTGDTKVLGITLYNYSVVEVVTATNNTDTADENAGIVVVAGLKAAAINASVRPENYNAGELGLAIAKVTDENLAALKNSVQLNSSDTINFVTIDDNMYEKVFVGETMIAGDDDASTIEFYHAFDIYNVTEAFYAMGVVKANGVWNPDTKIIKVETDGTFSVVK